MTGSPANLHEPASLSDAEIDAWLKRLHGTDSASELSRLHEVAAARIEDPKAARFHMTQAWVFALEAGDAARASVLADALRRMGGLR